MLVVVTVFFGIFAVGLAVVIVNVGLAVVAVIIVDVIIPIAFAVVVIDVVLFGCCRHCHHSINGCFRYC